MYKIIAISVALVTLLSTLLIPVTFGNTAPVHIPYFSGDLDSAVEQYDHFLAEDPNHADVLVALALTRMQLGKPADALPLFDKALTASARPEIANLLGEALIADGQLEQAVSVLERHNPHNENWELSLNLARALTLLERYEQALVHFTYAIQNGPPSTIVLNEYAKLLDRMGEYEQAIDMLSRSLRFDASQFTLYWELGTIAEKKGDYRQAAEFWQSAERIRSVPEIRKRIEQYKQYLPSEPPEIAAEPAPPQLVQHRTVRLAPNVSEPIRIGLLERANHLYLSGGKTISVKAAEGRIETLAANTLWEITLQEDGYVLLESENTTLAITPPFRLVMADSTSTFALYDVDYGQGYFWANRESRQYRGDLEFLLYSAGLTIVNELPLEEYLYSVVPSEMISSWPMEALKAQSVAARTYSEFNRGRYTSRGFDLLSSIASANYPGVTRETSRTTEAVDATTGMIMTYNGNPIDAVYSANNGGIISSSAEVWGGSRPYLLKGLEGDIIPTESPLIFDRFLREDVDVPSNPSSQRSQFRWTRAYSQQDLKYLAPSSIGQLVDVKIVSRGETGRVLEIAWIGTSGRLTVKGDAIRSSLGGLRSNLFVAYPVYSEGEIQSIVFWGAGWGHGVGMSQTGAAGMAHRGFLFSDILSLYYPNTELTIRETN